MSGNFFDDMDKARYSFSYMSDDGDRDITHTFRCDNAETWPTVLQEFLSFLNGVYGYDVSADVRIKNNPFSLDSRWSGYTYDDTDKPKTFPEARE